MTGVILAGGLGTRLRTVLPNTAKPMAPVEGRPFLYRLIEQAAGAGVSPVILCTGHLASQLREMAVAQLPAAVLFSEEDRPLGTAGALRLAWRNYPGTAPWLVMNGDSYAAIHLASMMEYHQRSGCRATIVAVRVDDGRRYGSLEWPGEGCCVTAFREKSLEPGPKWINGGVYIFEREFLDALPEQAPSSLETQAFPAWIPKGIAVYASEARFIDIGTPESYELAQTFFSEET